MRNGHILNLVSGKPAEEFYRPDRTPRWLLWLLVAVMLGVLGFIIWIGRIYDEADQPAPNHDPAFRNPAFHPGDEGVIDLRGRKAHQDLDEALDRPFSKPQEAR